MVTEDAMHYGGVGGLGPVCKGRGEFLVFGEFPIWGDLHEITCPDCRKYIEGIRQWCKDAGPLSEYQRKQVRILLGYRR